MAFFERRPPKAQDRLACLNQNRGQAFIGCCVTPHLSHRIWSACIESAKLYTLCNFILILLVSTGQVCFGQTEPQARKTITGNSCNGIKFQKERYVVRSSRVDDPFVFLPWVRIKEQNVATEISALVDGKPFSYDIAVTKALEIIDEEDFLPDAVDVRVRIRVEFVSVENCSDGKLDLVYRVYSSQILPVLSGTPEARVTERRTPQVTAGLTNVDIPSASPIRLAPAAGYDSADELSGGGRLELIPKSDWGLPFNSMVAEGMGSSKMRDVSAVLSGAVDSLDWLAQSDWHLNYINFSLPTGAGNLKGQHGSAQLSGMTHPFAHGNVAARFGGLFEGGNQQGAIRNEQLAPKTLANTDFGALKLYLGLASRLPHNVFSISYGLELGSVGPATRVDWRKYIGDIRHEFWYPLGDHRILDLESRFTIGGIQVPGKIPLPERFFGGNNEEFFIPDDSWQIRANPVIRAIPGSKFYRTADGAGGNQFLSYNLTAAYTLWRRPLVPVELTNDVKFKSLLEGQITSATSTEQIHYATKDPHYANVVARLPVVQSALTNLKETVTAARISRNEGELSGMT